MRCLYLSLDFFSTWLYSSSARLNEFWSVPICSLRVLKSGSPLALRLFSSLSRRIRVRTELVTPWVWAVSWASLAAESACWWSSVVARRREWSSETSLMLDWRCLISSWIDDTSAKKDDMSLGAPLR